MENTRIGAPFGNLVTKGPHNRAKHQVSSIARSRARNCGLNVARGLIQDVESLNNKYKQKKPYGQAKSLGRRFRAWAFASYGQFPWVVPAPLMTAKKTRLFVSPFFCARVTITNLLTWSTTPGPNLALASADFLVRHSAGGSIFRLADYRARPLSWLWNNMVQPAMKSANLLLLHFIETFRPPWEEQ